MKCRLPLFCFALMTAVGWAVDFPPSLLQVREQRLQGHPGRALEEVDRLRASHPSDGSAGELALEASRASLEWWLRPGESAASDEVRLARVRRECGVFLARFASDPNAAEIRLGFARVLAAYAKAQASRAEFLEDALAAQQAQQHAKSAATEADELLGQAILARRSVAPADGRVGTPGMAGPDEPQLRLERAANLLELARTLGTTLTETERHTQIVSRAIDLLRGVAATKGPHAWEAHAWLGRCYVELDDPQKALAEFKTVIWDSGPEAEPGRRLARYFRLLVYDQHPELYRAPRGDVVGEMVRAGEEWLKAYPAEIPTAEGHHVRYLLAGAYLKQGQRLARGQATLSSPAQRLYGEALRLYRSLIHEETEFASRARQAKRAAVKALAAGQLQGDVTKLAHFDDCYLRAQAEIGQLADEEGQPPSDAGATGARRQAASRDRHLRTALAALTRAMDLATEATDPAELRDACYLLGYAYLAAGDAWRAVVLNEHLARANPRGAESATAAGYALQAYVQVLAAEERAGVPAGVVDADRERLRSLASFTEAAWPQHPSADLARHQRGALAMRQRHYAEAVTALSRICPMYASFTAAQYDLASAALLAHQANLPTAPGGPGYLEQAVAALKRIPDLTDGSDPTTTQVYVSARLRLARLLYDARQFDELGRLTDRLSREVAAARFRDLGGATRDTLEELPFYVAFARADQAFRNGRVAEAAGIVGPAAAQASADGSPVRNKRLLYGLLGLALRAHVRLGQIGDARQDLGLLLRRTSQADHEERAAALAHLVEDLRVEVKEPGQRGPSADREHDAGARQWLAFLDEVAGQREWAADPDVTRFLAFGYASLGKHDRAAEVIGRQPRPAGPLSPQAEAADLATRLLLARELRLARRFEEAEGVLSSLASTEIGRRSRELRYERISLLEDRGQFAQAAREWDRLMKGLRPFFGQHPELEEARRQRPLTDAELKTLAAEDRHRADYYDCYYHIVACYARYAAGLADASRRSAMFQRAAGFVLRLEQGQPELWREDWKAKYDALFQEQPQLKEAYDQIKAAGS